MFETGRSSVKGRALSRDPRMSICVEDEEPPFGFVRVDGIAELSGLTSCPGRQDRGALHG